MRGFKAFRQVEEIPESALNETLKRINVENRYIYFTGGEYKFRRGSMRSAALQALKVERVPVPLADWIRLAARIRQDGTEIGYHPAAVRAGLVLHHGSKPAVYLELKKEEDGSYTSVRTIPYANPPIKEGDVVVPAPAKVEPAQIEVKDNEIVETAPSKARRAARKGKPAAKPAA